MHGYNVYILTLTHVSGTPNRITLLRPFLIKGPRNPSRRSTPHRFWPGSAEISTSAFGSSVIKIGYINIDLVRLRRDCHSRASGWWYPPCSTDLHRLSLWVESAKIKRTKFPWWSRSGGDTSRAHTCPEQADHDHECVARQRSRGRVYGSPIARNIC